MNKQKKLYLNKEWTQFAIKVKTRDQNKCLRCYRKSPEVILQVHHERYIKGKAPWEYALSDCITLCKGCHAKEHKLIEPDHDWKLIAIDDLGGLNMACQRKNCGAAIRYAHTIYHPNCGYKVVGSTCIHYLTQKEKILSQGIIKSYKNISDFVHHSEWQSGLTKNGKKFINTQYNHHFIRIYGEPNYYAYQLIIKKKGVHWYDYQDIKKLPNKSLEEVKELAYIVIKGTLAKKEKEKIALREIYKSLLMAHY